MVFGVFFNKIEPTGCAKLLVFSAAIQSRMVSLFFITSQNESIIPGNTMGGTE